MKLSHWEPNDVVAPSPAVPIFTPTEPQKWTFYCRLAAELVVPVPQVVFFSSDILIFALREIEKRKVLAH